MALPTNTGIQTHGVTETVASPSASASTVIASSAMKAFSIPEVFEMILLELPICDLFVQQRTCQLFKRNIEGSSKVQQKMFLEASPVSGYFVEDINPVLRDLSLFFGIRKGSIGCGLMALNADNKIELGYDFRDKSPNWSDMVPDHLRIGDTTSSTSMLRVNDRAASWRKMLPTRRVSATFSVVLTVQDHCRLRMSYRKIFPQGVLVGDILDKLDRQYDDLFQRSDELETKAIDPSFVGSTAYQLGSSTEDDSGVLTENALRTNFAAF